MNKSYQFKLNPPKYYYNFFFDDGRIRVNESRHGLFILRLAHSLNGLKTRQVTLLVIWVCDERVVVDPDWLVQQGRVRALIDERL